MPTIAGARVIEHPGDDTLMDGTRIVARTE